MKINEVLNGMDVEGLDCLLVLNPANITYLAGFKPSSFSVLIVTDKPKLFIPKLDLEESLSLSKIPVEEFKSLESLNDELKGNVGVEATLPLQTYQKLSSRLEMNITRIIEDIRMIKNPEEIKNIKKALKIAEEAFMLTKFEGSEDHAANVLEYNMRELGSSKPSFDTILASGERSSYPHASTSQKEVDSPVMVDWGATYNHYHSDTTRTLVNTNEEEEIFNIVLEAHNTALKAIKPGVKASYIDKVARNVIEEFGYGENFIHSTGHGVGLEVHENPSLSKKDDTKLHKGMIITIEPGIYLKDKFGVRIEDMVLVENRGKILNNLKKKL